jgi:hypothetical protein
MSGRVTEACQTLADLVKGRRIIHPGDPLLNEHKAGAARSHPGTDGGSSAGAATAMWTAPTPPPGRSWSR